jgi:hypothetical protein
MSPSLVNEDFYAPSRITSPSANGDSCVVDGRVITNEEILSFLANPPPGTRLVEWPYNSPYRFSPTLLIKSRISRVEFENQQCAGKLLDPAIVRVPRIYLYFERTEPYHGIFCHLKKASMIALGVEKVVRDIEGLSEPEQPDPFHPKILAVKRSSRRSQLKDKENR